MAAIAIYLAVAACLARAALTARKCRQQHWHERSWLLLLTFFLLLIALRGFGVEDNLRGEWRNVLVAAGEYDNRRYWQRLALASLLAVVLLIGGWLVYRFSLKIRGRRNIAVALALAGAIGMGILMALRWISLHDVDALLYGPFKLNWIGDIGLSCGTAAMAVYYVQVVRGQRQ